MEQTASVAAVDLGATSGRVILGGVSGGRIRMRHVARFPNQPVRLHEGDGPGLHWNITELYRSLTAGLAQAFREEPDVRSIGVDSWAVDYGLLRGGKLLGLPYHYRDHRTAGGVQAVHAAVSPEELYSRSGLQHLPFNTVFQLAVDRQRGDLAMAERALMIPDLIAYWLTGRQVTEETNAATTGLLDARTRQWDTALMDRLGLSADLFAPLIAPGKQIGRLLPFVAEELGAPAGVPVTAVGSHDTASAVVAVPFADENAAFISSGTWSLVGVELPGPVLTPESHAANFTNEGGVDGRIRYLKNVSGLWLLSESIRTWDGPGTTDSQRTSNLAELISQAAAVTAPVPVFDVQDERFTAPGDMPARITAWCEEHGVQPPRGRAEMVRSILESLAAAYADVIEQMETLTGRSIRTVHVVGGGSQNTLLCQLTADRTGRTVYAGPVEATAIGNVLVQARAAGLVSGGLEELRRLVARTFEPIRYEPRVRAAL
ncbi:rhamnulokinase [Arthrobacter sp. BL-252-APC-1A]|uniref:rhamnulokinase n=1 Tax=Arthrobacter sp. BL-252-APC-1A TaxID=2606622 RepID=UPI0012B3D157|nr:rhamnulokinase family protein [Arthrobacter sp. BL-252-APC-1A]MSS00202.1 rhamnulokinase [Arthrobacter sp. BL-252-APC-1A]